MIDDRLMRNDAILDPPSSILDSEYER